MPDSDYVPLMFQAQLANRGKIHYSKESETVYQWVDQWLKCCPDAPTPVYENVPKWKQKPVKTSGKIPKFSPKVETQKYTINWRLVTNSGQDEGFIRPVIGAKGFPFYPGSSMKGAFLRVCPNELKADYCGTEIKENGQTKTKPGILRFHGAYPVDMSWGNQKLLVDIVHYQQPRQVEEDCTTTANPQISLYETTLLFGISSTKNLGRSEWEKIWEIWEKALGIGIGSRVSAGYGRFSKHENDGTIQEIVSRDKLIFSVYLSGQGLTSQLLNNTTPEFRPNMFKAVLRGHTLRILGGITDAKTAKTETQKLWGGIDNGTFVGKLGISFTAEEIDLGQHTYKPKPNKTHSMSTYDLREGRLDILYLGNSDKEKVKLKKFVTQLVQFSVLLGGFGKSWRRVNHRKFWNQYFKDNDKPMIGCHWEFLKESEDLYLTCGKSDIGHISKFLHDIQQNFASLLNLNNDNYTPWRETWHINNVQVWAKISKTSEAVEWFHGNYTTGKRIYKTDLTGRIGNKDNPSKVGRIWHRMYPRYVIKDGKLERLPQYVELLTLFPDDSDSTRQFLEFLEDDKQFIKIFPRGN
jgi:CRISPR-associated protein Cmr6